METKFSYVKKFLHRNCDPNTLRHVHTCLCQCGLFTRFLQSHAQWAWAIQFLPGYSQQRYKVTDFTQHWYQPRSLQYSASKRFISTPEVAFTKCHTHRPHLEGWLTPVSKYRQMCQSCPGLIGLDPTFTLFISNAEYVYNAFWCFLKQFELACTAWCKVCWMLDTEATVQSTCNSAGQLENLTVIALSCTISIDSAVYIALCCNYLLSCALRTIARLWKNTWAHGREV